MPGGSASAGAQFLSRLNDLVIRSDGNGDDSFWANLFDQALVNAIDLCLLAKGRASIDEVYKIIATSPATLAQVGDDKFYKNSHCGKLLDLAYARKTPDCERRYERVKDFWLREASTIGEKARGALLSMCNGLLGKFIIEPFFDATCTETTVDYHELERESQVWVLDFPVLMHGMGGRLFQSGIQQLGQMHGLRRDADGVERPLIIARDEAGLLLTPEFDTQVQVVARSQKLVHIDAFQDLDVAISALGGHLKAKHEMNAFVSNHRTIYAFSNGNVETNEFFSRLAGHKREIMISGNGGRPAQPSGNLTDDVLGVKSDFGFSEQYQPLIRPEQWFRLPVGCCYAFSGGQVQYLDLREKR